MERAKVGTSTGVPEDGAGDGGGLTKLPPALYPLFPEYDASALTLEGDRATIVGRLLAAPDLSATRWLLAHVPQAELAAFVVRREGRGLDPKALRFWGLMLDLPRSQVDAWVRRVLDEPWGRRTTR